MTPKAARSAVEAKHEVQAAVTTVRGFAERDVSEHGLRPITARNYRQLLATRILPMFAEVPLIAVTLSDIKTLQASFDPGTPSTNASVCRLLRSILQSAEESEQIGRAPHRRSADLVRRG